MKVAAGSRGVLLPDALLALDVHHPDPGWRSVCSHAHSDHIPFGAAETHATPATADLLALRAPQIRVRRHAYGEPFELNGARVTFFPSGHVLGAALTLVEHRGETLLYTADFKLREPFTCDPCARGLSADALVVESTFALPVYQFPSSRDAQAKAARFAEEVLESNGTPVFLGYNLGKAHELARLLGERGVNVAMHGAAWSLAQVYRAHGVELPNCEAYDKDAASGKALVAPPSVRGSPMIANLKGVAVAYCSGWAALESQRAQMNADLLLPLSDHCDFPDLVRFVDEVRPRKVYANHGYSDVFCRVLAKRGVAAEALHAGRFDEEEGEGAAVPEVPGSGSAARGRGDARAGDGTRP